MISTTPEQSARLIACGVDPNTADMGRVIVEATDCLNGWQEMRNIKEIEWWNREVKASDGTILQPGVKTEHGWSLTALLGLLPKAIKVDEDPYSEVQKYGLLIYPFMGGWQVDYQYCENDECHCLKCTHATDLVEACVKAIEWLTGNNHKLNEQ